MPRNSAICYIPRYPLPARLAAKLLLLPLLAQAISPSSAAVSPSSPPAPAVSSVAAPSPSPPALRLPLMVSHVSRPLPPILTLPLPAGAAPNATAPKPGLVIVHATPSPDSLPASTATPAKTPDIAKAKPTSSPESAKTQPQSANVAKAKPTPSTETAPVKPSPTPVAAKSNPASPLSPKPVLQAESILKKRCYSCHSSDTAMSGLNLQTPEGRKKGGSRGPALLPGDADHSRLYRLVAQLEAPHMPPGAPLPAEEIAALKQWINDGVNSKKPAPAVPSSPRSTVVAATTAASKPPVVSPAKTLPEAPSEELSGFWAAQPAKRVPIPTVKDKEWVKTPIDAFVLQRLEKAGLTPSPRADRRTLIRRAYYDLIGLPPAPEQIQEFLNDPSPDDYAFSKVVDRLLASPQYGERWGRHWLDLVRYAETNGYERDGPKSNAWRYRDYVIRSFNEDKPYSQFIMEQLAGDELDTPTNESRIATGYYRLGLWDDEPGDHLLDRYDQLDDVVKTTSNVFLGVTLNCARCHDHKFDPFTQKDYYRFLAFFSASKLGTEKYPNGQHKAPDDQIYLADPPQVKQYEAALSIAIGRINEAQKAYDDLHNAVKDQITAELKAGLPAPERAALDAPAEGRTDEQKALADNAMKAITPSEDEIGMGRSEAEKEKLQELKNRLKEAQDSKPAPLPTALGLTDVAPADVPKTALLKHGNPRDPGEDVEPGFPATLAAYNPPVQPPPPDSPTTKRRLQLAQWIASPQNPLTARVLVNRVWNYHFGEGIVRTPNDFGTMGERPTHPDLLDWLAADFTDTGGRLKRLHRMILLSSSWQQSSARRDDAEKIDPQNRLLWRMNYRRLEAEPIRDAMLAASGKLNLQMEGPSVFPKLPVTDLVGQVYTANTWGTSDEAQADRRSVYIFVKRSLRVPMMEAFDAADPSEVCPVRNITTVAPQALSLLNNGFVWEQATHLAERIRKDAGDDPAKQIERAYALTLGRPPTPDETQKTLDFLKSQRERVPSGQTDKDALPADPLVDFCHALFNLNEFVYVD